MHTVRVRTYRHLSGEDGMHNGAVTPCINNVTVTLEPLVHQAIQQGAAVVTEGGAGIRVGAELVQSGLATTALLTQAG